MASGIVSVLLSKFNYLDGRILFIAGSFKKSMAMEAIEAYIKLKELLGTNNLDIRIGYSKGNPIFIFVDFDSPRSSPRWNVTDKRFELVKKVIKILEKSGDGEFNISLKSMDAKGMIRTVNSSIYFDSYSGLMKEFIERIKLEESYRKMYGSRK